MAHPLDGPGSVGAAGVPRRPNPDHPGDAALAAQISTASLNSPMTGSQPGAPYLNGLKSGAPAPFLLRRYQVPVAGSTVPMPVLPELVQSPATGSQPGAP